MNKNLIGVIIIIGIAVSWCSNRQFTFVIESSDGFQATFFIMWFQTSFISLSIFYPILTCQKIKVTLKEDRMGFNKLIKMGFLFYVLWMISNYMAILALKNISSSLMVTVFSVSPAFVYILSRIILKEENNLIKVLAVFFAVSGVLLIGISQKLSDGNVIGVFFSIISSLITAFYIVLLKILIGATKIVTSTVFLAVIGIINIFLFWPVFLILNYFEIEIIIWNEIPWGYLTISAITGLFFNAFVNIGVGYTGPLFISIGTILGIPVNIFVDKVVHGLDITFLQIFGSLLVMIAFCLLVFSGMKFNSESINENIEQEYSEKLFSNLRNEDRNVETIKHFLLETV